MDPAERTQAKKLSVRRYHLSKDPRRTGRNQAEKGNPGLIIHLKTGSNRRRPKIKQPPKKESKKN
jgi:hypothetical protein